jgi:hypothetical protein
MSHHCFFVQAPILKPRQDLGKLINESPLQPIPYTIDELDLILIDGPNAQILWRLPISYQSRLPFCIKLFCFCFLQLEISSGVSFSYNPQIFTGLQGPKPFCLIFQRPKIIAKVWNRDVYRIFRGKSLPLATFSLVKM